MTYNSWKIREKGLERVGINFKSASLLYNPDTIRIFAGSKEASIVDQVINLPNNNNNLEFNSYQLIDVVSGYSSNKYKKLSKIFKKEEMVFPSSKFSYLLGIKGRSDKYLMEDCRVVNTTCINNNGTTNKCLPGRCFGGNIEFSLEENNNSIFNLKITRGQITKNLIISNKFFDSEPNEIFDYQIDILNNTNKLIYYPDSDKKFYKSLQGKIRLPLQLLYEVNGYGNFLSDFFNKTLFYIFKSTCDGPAEVCIKEAKNRLNSSEVVLFVNEIKERINSLQYSEYIKSEINSAIDSIEEYSNLDEYITECYNRIFAIFNSISFVIDSGFITSNKEKYRGELKGRPVYSRLPSSNFGYNIAALEEEIIFLENIESRFNLKNIDSGQIVVSSDRSEGYKYIPRIISSIKERIKFGLNESITDFYDKDQIYSPKDPSSWRKLDKEEMPPLPVTRWVLEGVDELLIESKEKIDRFYSEYLDPDTCFSNNLDWLAQHIGLNDSIYLSAQSEAIKRTLIKNALGWFDSTLEFEVIFSDGTVKTYKTIKGKVLDDAPFNNSQWSSTDFTTNKLIKSYTLGGSKVISQGKSVLQSRSLNNKILLERVISNERRKLLSSDGYYLIFDNDFFLEEENTYEYFLVRFSGEILPNPIQSTEKYLLKKVDTNKYDIYSDFGNKVFIDEFDANSDIFAENLFKLESQDIEKFIYNKSIWEGIYQSKGSRLGVSFALSLPSTKSKRFVHAHILEELKVEENNGADIYSVKSGLREYELESKSPLLRPWERSFLQVGDETGNFDNQLIADLSEVKDESSSYDLVFRMPFYYNKNGRTWNYVLSVKENWIPANVNSRIQYPYLASELWSVGDAFFELEIDE